MKTLKRTGQGLIGLILAALLAMAVSTLVFPEENDELFRYGGFRLGVTGIGAGLALAVLLAFADGWIGTRNRQGSARFPGTLFNGIGFGLLPGLAIWKAAEQYSVAGKGTEIPEKSPSFAWFSAEGRYLPCRMEFVLVLAAFGAMILWLALRKEDLPENGDLMPVSVTLWGMIRLMTGNLQEVRPVLPAIQWFASAVAASAMLVCLLFWIRRLFRKQKNTGYAYACVPVFAVSVSGILLQDLQILFVNPSADLTIRAVCALLAMKAGLCAGRVSRG